jgi:beta-ribofuranosylaminobenzene 5'-phosphate synthase
MSAAVVEVSAPSRLHFGMFSFGHSGVRQFGGVGAMVDPGALQLHVEPAERFCAQGPLVTRVQTAARRIAEGLDLGELPACRINVLKAPAEHVGLGTGTQLQLSLAAALNAFVGNAPLDLPALVALAGRGARSAIGSHGFIRGGLLVDQGKLEGEGLSPLADRVELPGSWRFVLLCPQGQVGLAGEREQLAFRDLPPVPSTTTERLHREVAEEMLPAAQAGQFERFGESLYRFNREAGLCFAPWQGGAFAGPSVARLVEIVRSLGVRGAGQSSWGPTVFALVENHDEALRFEQALAPHIAASDRVVIVQPANRGAVVSMRQP